jgi:hypothetical protein
MERTEDNLIDAINQIGTVYAGMDYDCGVVIYPSYADYRHNPNRDYAFIVSDEYTSYGDVYSYGANNNQIYKMDPHERDLVCDEIVQFIYGGGKYAAKQLTTA